MIHREAWYREADQHAFHRLQQDVLREERSWLDPELWKLAERLGQQPQVLYQAAVSDSLVFEKLQQALLADPAKSMGPIKDFFWSAVEKIPYTVNLVPLLPLPDDFFPQVKFVQFYEVGVDTGENGEESFDENFEDGAFRSWLSEGDPDILRGIDPEHVQTMDMKRMHRAMMTTHQRWDYEDEDVFVTYIDGDHVDWSMEERIPYPIVTVRVTMETASGEGPLNVKWYQMVTAPWV